MKSVTTTATRAIINEAIAGKKIFVVEEGVLDQVTQFKINDNDLGILTALLDDAALFNVFHNTINEFLDCNFCSIEDVASSSTIADQAGTLQVMILAVKLASQL